MHLIISKDKEELRRALHSLMEEKPAACFSPETFSSDAFSQEVETFPFLAKQKSIVVQEVDSLSKEHLETLCSYVEKPSEWITLYLTATQLSSQHRLVKRIEKQGKVVRYKEEKPWDKEKRLANWLSEEAEKEGVTLSLQAATVLVKAVDHRMLLCELEKLVCFVGKRSEITVEDISLLSTPIHHETLWQLGDALFASDYTQALKIGKILLEEGMAIFPLLASLRSQFKTGLEILQAAKTGEVAQKFPYLKGRLLDKKLGALKAYGPERLQKGLNTLFDAELRAKQAVDPELLLELTLVKL